MLSHLLINLILFECRDPRAKHVGKKPQTTWTLKKIFKSYEFELFDFNSEREIERWLFN